MSHERTIILFTAFMVAVAVVSGIIVALIG